VFWVPAGVFFTQPGHMARNVGQFLYGAFSAVCAIVGKLPNGLGVECDGNTGESMGAVV
jgi:hypothetical protein